MFTGIVQATGLVHSALRCHDGMRLLLERRGWDVSVRPGDSVSVAGVCLTHAPRNDHEAGPAMLAFDVVEETLRKTSLGERNTGDAVNLELSLTPQTPMGGHIVQGHVDGTGVVRKLARDPECVLAIECDDSLMDYVVPKGSIAVEGVSLTIASTGPCRFSCSLIETTLQHTTLGHLKAGNRVNIETDIVSRTVVNWLRRNYPAEDGQSVTANVLRSAGFMGR